MAEPIVFKAPFAPINGWFSYATILIVLLLLIAIIIKKYKQTSAVPPNCRLVETTRLGNKTVLYLVDYQQQRFLLADNQQSLALHVLNKEVSDEKV